MPSLTWDELTTRYSEFAAMPAWRAAGDVRPSIKNQGKAKAALDGTIIKLKNRFPDQWPPSPLQFKQQHVHLLFRGKDLKGGSFNPRRGTSIGRLWTAIILDHYDFRCCWCGRSAFETFEREGRTLRLELDHQTPRASGGVTLSLQNIRAACRSCNTLRGRLPPDMMRAELISIVQSILKTKGLAPCQKHGEIMTHSISLIYGDDVIDDLQFCCRHNDVIDHYSHGIMTLQGSPLRVLDEVAMNPANIPGWVHSLTEHPEHTKILQEFFKRLISYYKKTGIAEDFHKDRNSAIIM